MAVTAPICTSELPDIVAGSYTLRSASVILRREASSDGNSPASRLKTTTSTAPVMRPRSVYRRREELREQVADETGEQRRDAEPD
jgi:hypothetical protein